MASTNTQHPAVVEGAAERYLDAPIDALSEKVADEIAKCGGLIKVVKARTGRHADQAQVLEIRGKHGVIEAVIHKAMHNVLTGDSSISRKLRMDLMETLVVIEKQVYDKEVEVTRHRKASARPGAKSGEGATPADDSLISTAEAGKILGFSRTYVAMLVDNKKLPISTISTGGHRRLRKSDVLSYRDEMTVKPKGDADYKAAAQAAGMYDIPEEQYVKMAKRPTTKNVAAKRAKRVMKKASE